ncbi:MAG: ribose-5-phosphate isomerase RpiA [Candidatus Bathyarchaeota archaeon]|nr:MAG: ribose-5-phosphate isomerase RpiA [Candidatus Bathyarchaeota archaeon]
MLSSVQDAKKRAALASIELIKDGYVVGLGTGSTVNYMLEELGRTILNEDLKILGIPSSTKTAILATKHQIPLTTLEEHPRLDVAIDGADQVDPALNLIKGMGGALTREKIIDSAASLLAIIVDESKVTSQLGFQQVVPVEVIPFAITPVSTKLQLLGGIPILRSSSEHTYFLTDNGNAILDVDFGLINDPASLEKQIKLIPGVVESGLFINMAKTVYIGTSNDVKQIDKRNFKP